MKLQGPIEIDLKVKIISEDMDQQGTVTIGISDGTYPTEEKLRELVSDFSENDMPEGFRLMNKREFWDVWCSERTASQERFALPGGDDWDA